MDLHTEHPKSERARFLRSIDPSNAEALNAAFARLGQPPLGSGPITQGVEMAPGMISILDRPPGEMIADLRAGRAVRSPWGNEWRDRRYSFTVAIPELPLSMQRRRRPGAPLAPGQAPGRPGNGKGPRPPGAAAMRRVKSALRSAGVGLPDGELRLEEGYLYATRFYGAGALVPGEQNNLFFSAQIGAPATIVGYAGAVGNLTMRETNLTEAGRVPNSRNMVLDEMGIVYTNTGGVLGDIHQLYEAASLTYLLQPEGTRIQFGPSRLWTGGAGLTGFTANTNVAARELAAAAGVPSPKDVRRFHVPRILEGGKNFAFAFDIARLLNPITGLNYALAGNVEVTWWWWGWLVDKIPS